jgi:hypothetical protein
LAAVSSVLTALDADKEDAQVGPGGAKALDAAGYESVSCLSHDMEEADSRTEEKS